MVMGLHIDSIILIISLTLMVVVWFRCESNTRKYLLIWLGSSLIMPLLVAIFRSNFGNLVLLFWPGSIVLMSLGAESRPAADVTYVWVYGIALNLIFYFIIGLLVRFIFGELKKTRIEDKKRRT